MATATEHKAPLTIQGMLDDPRYKNQIAAALPKHVTAERMIRVALTALNRVPNLVKCTNTSFFKCLMDCSQWGLEPDGRRAHLIPFENKKKGIFECTLVLDYKGIAELCFRSGDTQSITAEIVRRGDIFEYSLGRVRNHVPWYLRDPATRPSEAGEIYAVFCIIQLRGDGAEKHEVMSIEDVHRIRDRSQGYIAFKKGWAKTSVWDTDFPEMAKKTVFKRASKWVPWSAEVRSAIEYGDDGEEIDLGNNVSLLTHQPAKTLDDLVGKPDQRETVRIDADPVQQAEEFSPAPDDDRDALETMFRATFDSCKTEAEISAKHRALADEFAEHRELILKLATERELAL